MKNIIEEIKSSLRTFSVFLWYVILCGCLGGCSSSLEQRADKSERDINSLKKAAKKIRDDAVNSKKELGEQLVKCDEIITKTEALLGKNPEVVIPPKPQPINPSPDPINPSPSPKPVDPIKPLPQPDPVIPVPPPKPEGPEDGRFEVARAVWGMAQKIQSPDLKTEATMLADNFESIASKVAAGGLNSELPFGQEESGTVQALRPQWMVISDELSKLNRPIIEKHEEVWTVPAEKLGKTIAKFYKDGKLKTNKDWSDLFKEIAIGLRAVK